MNNNQRENLAAFFEYNGNTAVKTKAGCGHYAIKPVQNGATSVCEKCALLMFNANTVKDAVAKSRANADQERIEAIKAFDAMQARKEEDARMAKEVQEREASEKAAQEQAQADESKGADSGDSGNSKDDSEDKFVPYSVYTPKVEEIDSALANNTREIKRAHERMDNGQKEIELAKSAFDSHTATLRMHAGRLENLENIATGREAEMIAIAKQFGGKGGTKTIKIKVNDAKPVKLGGQHHAQFPLLLQTCSARLGDGHRLNVWLKGPAGTGKTTAARNVASALNLPFAFNGALDSEYKLKGFIDAAGKIISSPFRTAWTNGGVYLFDEVDASLPSAVLAFNAALANGSCDFPDANVTRHADCVVIAAANTFGNGATAEYVGRAKQDAAFLDRFVAIDWHIDEELERSLTPIAPWCEYVQKVRAVVKQRGIKGIIVSPRASIFGAALLASGIGVSQVIGMTVRKGMTDDQWKEVSGEAGTLSQASLGDLSTVQS